MACPQVSGFAALIRTMRPDLNGQQVRALIENNVQLKSDYTDLVSSGGLIDVGKTLKALKSESGGNYEIINIGNLTSMLKTKICQLSKSFNCVSMFSF